MYRYSVTEYSTQNFTRALMDTIIISDSENESAPSLKNAMVPQIPVGAKKQLAPLFTNLGARGGVSKRSAATTAAKKTVTAAATLAAKKSAPPKNTPKAPKAPKEKKTVQLVIRIGWMPKKMTVRKSTTWGNLFKKVIRSARCNFGKMYYGDDLMSPDDWNITIGELGFQDGQQIDFEGL